MDVHFELKGVSFVWNQEKAADNPVKHDGITFEQAAQMFFDPLLRLVDASRNGESRDAAIGYDDAGKLLFVVHIEQEEEAIRIISARAATPIERREHEHS